MDSLVAGDGLTSIELVPEDAMGVGWHLLGPDYSLGDPQAITTAIRSLLLDGSTVVGRQSDNRDITFSVQVKATSRNDLTIRENQLRSIVERAVWTLSWTPEGGATTVFDCFRGQVETGWDEREEGWWTRQVNIVCRALPFGRNPTSGTLPLEVMRSGTSRWREYEVADALGNARSPLALSMTRNSGADELPVALVHSPPATADPLIPKVLSVPGLSTVTVDVTAHPFDGTYAIIGVIDPQLVSYRVLGPGGGVHTVVQAVGITIVETVDGVTTGSQTLNRVITDSTGNTGYIVVGTVTLPFRRITEAAVVEYQFTIISAATDNGVTSVGGGHDYFELLVLDTAGQLAFINDAQGVGGETSYSLDVVEPTPLQSIGDVLVSLPPPSTAKVGAEGAFVSGGPFIVDPIGGPKPDGSYGPAPILAHFSTLLDPGGFTAKPDLVASYSPRWLGERESDIEIL